MNHSQNKKQKTIENKKMITDSIDKPLNKDNIKNKKGDNNAQRALVLQGGGALASLRSRSLWYAILLEKKRN